MKTLRKTLSQVFIWTIFASILIYGIAEFVHAQLDKSNEVNEPTNMVIIADESPVGTYNWAAVLASVAALAVSVLTLVSQDKVADNTSKLSNKAQKQAMLDLVRHLYRNMVVMWAIVNRMDDAAQRNKNRRNNITFTSTSDKYSTYPSELHLIKAQAPIDNIHPELFVSNDYKYNKVNSLILQLRNYNTELSIAATQLKDSTLSKDTKDYYIDTLLFKPAQLTNTVIEVLNILEKKSYGIRTTIFVANILNKHYHKLWSLYVKHKCHRYGILLEVVNEKNYKDQNDYFIERLRLKNIIRSCEEVITKCHEKNVQDNKECKHWSKPLVSYCEVPKNEDMEKLAKMEKYIKYIFNSKKEAIKFFSMLNEDAHIECGKNSAGGDKLLMI